MSVLAKAGLCLAVLFVSIAIVPAAKADPITISAAGFSLSNLGNNGGGNPGSDSLVGANSTTTTATDAGTMPFVINLLTFSTGFTGIGSAGSHPFDFSQPLTINGQTQVLNLSGVIDISQTVDTIHILSSGPLTFNFSTFSVDVNIIPTDIVGAGADGGNFSDVLKAELTVMPQDCNTVPEPATLSLLGLGIAGVAAKIRQRRKRALT